MSMKISVSTFHAWTDINAQCDLQIALDANKQVGQNESRRAFYGMHTEPT
jgi:hypothetical protein